MSASVYESLKAASVPLDSHASDLYAQVTAESSAIVRAAIKAGTICGVKVFTSQIDGKPWYDIPFVFAPWWEAKQSGRPLAEVLAEKAVAS